MRIPSLEDFERTESDEGGSYPGDDSTPLLDGVSVVEYVPHHSRVRGDTGTCASGGNAQIVHCFTAEELTDARTETPSRRGVLSSPG